MGKRSEDGSWPDNTDIQMFHLKVSFASFIDVDTTEVFFVVVLFIFCLFCLFVYFFIIFILFF